MRKIKTADVFLGMRLIQRSGLKEKLVPVIKGISDEDITSVGILGFLSVLEVFGENSCEHLIYELLSGPLERSPEEISNMDLAELSDNLEMLGKENDLKHFFSVLSGLLSKRQ